ncbi:hypothetical protein ACFPRL_01365 [Pseudoclavibacter helvolus]
MQPHGRRAAQRRRTDKRAGHLAMTRPYVSWLRRLGLPRTASSGEPERLLG